MTVPGATERSKQAREMLLDLRNRPSLVLLKRTLQESGKGRKSKWREAVRRGDNGRGRENVILCGRDS